MKNLNSTIHFGQNAVGGGEPCFVVMEAGPTQKNQDEAKELVEVAASAHADAVKFQFINADMLVSDKKQLFDYEVLINRETGQSERVQEPLHQILARRERTKEEFAELCDFSHSLNLKFFLTVCFIEEIEFSKSIGVDSIKIASADVNHTPLLKAAGESGLCVQLDTGNSTIGEIENAVNCLAATGASDIIIHHCPSGYPATPDNVNLNVIKTLKQMFPCPIAFSDHSPGWNMDIAAVALGASMVEKTITLDRTERSVEHIMSLEPVDAKCFVKDLREIEAAFGKSTRTMGKAEIEKRDLLRRSPCIVGSVMENTPLAELTVEYRRPGSGLSPDMFEQLKATHKINKSLPPGHTLRLIDVTPL